jgi:hypothetical protein
VADGYNPLNSSLSAYTGLIGYYVNGAVYDFATGEIVAVSGEVASLLKGAYEDYAMLSGVNAVIAGLNKNGSIVEDRAKTKEYLDEILSKADESGRRIEVFITDDSGKRVPVSALLRSYEVDPVYGTIKAVLDEVASPVTSVAAIRKAPAAAAQDEAANGAGKGNGDKGDTDKTEKTDANNSNADVNGNNNTNTDKTGNDGANADKAGNDGLNTQNVENLTDSNEATDYSEPGNDGATNNNPGGAGVMDDQGGGADNKAAPGGG